MSSQGKMPHRGSKRCGSRAQGIAGSTHLVVMDRPVEAFSASEIVMNVFCNERI